VARRTWVFRKNEETGEVESIEITAQPVEWRIGGTRYGSETLERMKKEGLVPPETFKDHWEKKAAERESIYRLGQGDLSQLKGNSDPKVLQRKREMYAHVQRIERSKRRG
jgi:hypothetical protein